MRVGPCCDDCVMQDHGRARGDRRRPSWGLVYTHGGVVAVLLALFTILVVLADPAGGANIGAGIALLPVLALGLPWSLPVLINPYSFDAVPELVWYLLHLGPAVFNVALHAAVTGWLRRR